MEKVIPVSYILIALVFLFSFSANLSTEHTKRRRLYVGAFTAGIFFFGISSFYFIRNDFTDAWVIMCIFFAGLGILLPQLISQIFARQKIKHPVIFLPKKKVPVTPLVVAGAFLLFMIWVALFSGPSSLPGNISDNAANIWWGFGLSIVFVSLIIIAIQAQVERDAICENGFYQGGLLSDWSNFESYSWSHDKMYSDPDIQSVLDQNTVVELTLEPKHRLVTKQIRLAIPFRDKNVIENILSKNVQLFKKNSSTLKTAHR